MANKQGSAGVSAKEIDISGPLTQLPTGIPAGVIGTATKGPAFVPITVGNVDDFYAKFGKTDGVKFGPLAVVEWLRRAKSVTYLRVLGVGDGLRRVTSGQTAGSVTSAGFVVGSRLPGDNLLLQNNPYAVHGVGSTVEGRTYFLGTFMSESAGSTVFSSAGLQGQYGITPGVNSSLPIIRGVLMAPSGVILRLSASWGGTNDSPSSTAVASDASAYGDLVGNVDFGTNAKQEFVMLLNGHKNTLRYPNVITASFDLTSPSYFANVFNTTPESIQEAGHYLYAYWDIHPTTAVLTGTSLTNSTYGAQAAGAPRPKGETIAFLTTGSLARNLGSSTVPNYEAFTDRFGYAKSPWIISQKFGGSYKNLFRFYAIDAGSSVSDKYKISVKNITPSSDPQYLYGSFDVEVRSWDDRDEDTKVVESFSAVNLDPGSDRYIAKVIGDQHVFYDFDRSETAQKLVVAGNYPQRSNLIRVEVNSDIENGFIDATALPMGFRGIEHLVTSGSAPLMSVNSVNVAQSQLNSSNLLNRAITPPVPMRQNIQVGSGDKVIANPMYYWGVQFEHVTNLSTPNASTYKNDSLKSFAKYFPNFSTVNQNFVVGDNTGAVDTDNWGIIDADRFCNNLFNLENIQVKTLGVPSTTAADPEAWSSAVYVRTGSIVTNVTNQTRALKVSDLNQSNKKFAKFTLFMQGGFDGVNLFDKSAAEINNNAVTGDMDDTNRGRNNGPNVRSYIKALDIMKNVVNVDVQLLAIPGIRHPIVTDAASEAVRDRFDAMYIMDLEQYDVNGTLITSNTQQHSVTNTIQNFSNRAIDNNFVAAYYPDVLVQDPNTQTNVIVPPSVVVLGAMSLNDVVGKPWFAPAGYSRGSLVSTLETQVKFSQSNLDDLYNASINPLVAFPSVGNGVDILKPVGGVIVWGQKTLQSAASALDRVNVRRLLIEIRRQVREISQTIIFEPNRAATLAAFSAAVTPRLQIIQSQAGLQRFKVIIDSSTTTQQDIENNTIRGKIFVQPTKTIEFVSLDFVVSNFIQQLFD